MQERRIEGSAEDYPSAASRAARLPKQVHGLWSPVLGTQQFLLERVRPEVRRGQIPGYILWYLSTLMPGEYIPQQGKCRSLLQVFSSGSQVE